MRGREGVIDVEIAAAGKLLREVGIVLLLALVEAQVLQHGDFARAQRVDRALGGGADALGHELYGACEQVAELCCNRVQRERRIGAFLGTPEVRDDDHARAAGAQIAQAGEQPLQAA